MITVNFQWNPEVAAKKPEEIERNSLKVDPSVRFFHRKLEELYLDLPWPVEVKQITVLTETPGGRGDVSAAAKMMRVLEKQKSDLKIDWILPLCLFNVKPFLDASNLGRVTITKWGGKSDLLILGPAENGWGLDYIQSKFGLDLQGPRFDFLEAGTDDNFKQNAYIASKCGALLDVFNFLFPLSKCAQEGIRMGLLSGSGIFFDQSRLDTKLSRSYCCPKALLEIQDKSLLDSLGRELDYDCESLNFGYAHHARSWERFIDFVALHEDKKNVTIVLNQDGEGDSFCTQEFFEEIFTQKRIQFLEQIGYSSILVKGANEKYEVGSEGQRRLIVILQKKFTPNDMKQLQLASERLLATGMNTPAESWAARCKLYMYEDVSNGGVTDEFLRQQVTAASSVSPKLSRFLELAGKHSLVEEEMDEAVTFLRNPHLAEATLQFCDHVTSTYRFEKAFLGSLKRRMWHHKIPNLMGVELEALGEEFKDALSSYVRDFDGKRSVKMENLSEVADAIKKAVDFK